MIDSASAVQRVHKYHIRYQNIVGIYVRSLCKKKKKYEQLNAAIVTLGALGIVFEIYCFLQGSGQNSEPIEGYMDDWECRVHLGFPVVAEMRYQ